MLDFRFKYISLILTVFLFKCKTTKTEEFIPYKTSISWGSPTQPTSYQITTKELRSNKIPDSVFKMTQLTLLTITGMDCDYGDTTTCWMIREIPSQIKHLTNLKSLILNVNGITKIPPDMQSLKKLTFLDLSDNPGLYDIENLTGLPNLQNLLLYGCNLSKLPNDMKKLKNLKVLGLVGNNINKIELSKIERALPECKIIF
jgi:Leucine-rich repeat (LRR) protein